MRTRAIGRSETVTAIVRESPPADAAICVVPGAIAVATPACVTVTTERSCDDQKTFAVGSSTSLVPNTRAVNVASPPTTRVRTDGLTSSRVTSSISEASGLSHEASSAAYARARDHRRRFPNRLKTECRIQA